MCFKGLELHEGEKIRLEFFWGDELKVKHILLSPTTFLLFHRLPSWSTFDCVEKSSMNSLQNISSPVQRKKGFAKTEGKIQIYKIVHTLSPKIL